MKVYGVVLAGGNAVRMGGGDKCLLDLGGQPLLTRILNRLRPQVEHCAINANGNPARFAAWGMPVLADELEDAGPLAGILAGMKWAADKGATHIVSVAGDTPFFPRDLVPHLSTPVNTRTPLSAACTDGRVHPVFGLWPVSLRDELQKSLLQGVRKIDQWTAKHGCAKVAFEVVHFDPFFNINTLKDYQIAKGLTAK